VGVGHGAREYPACGGQLAARLRVAAILALGALAVGILALGVAHRAPIRPLAWPTPPVWIGLAYMPGRLTTSGGYPFTPPPSFLGNPIRTAHPAARATGAGLTLRLLSVTNGARIARGMFPAHLVYQIAPLPPMVGVVGDLARLTDAGGHPVLVDNTNSYGGCSLLPGQPGVCTQEWNLAPWPPGTRLLLTVQSLYLHPSHGRSYYWLTGPRTLAFTMHYMKPARARILTLKSHR